MSYPVFKNLLEQLNFGTVETEFRFHPKRRWRFDFAIPESLIAFEIDGGTWNNGRHSRGIGFANDCEKINEAQLLGWRVFRFTPSQLRLAETYDFLDRLKIIYQQSAKFRRHSC